MRRILSVLLISLTCLSATQAAGYTATRGTLSIYYQVAADQQHLDTVFETWARTSQRLAKLGLKTGTVQLIASRHAADFTQRTGKAAHIAGLTRGQTIYTQRLGALAQKQLLKSTIQHEAFHTAQPKHLPRWLAEGLARIFSEQTNQDPRRTGLEHLSPQELNQALRQSPPKTLQLAYAEASNRAWHLLQRQGWQQVLTSAHH